MLSIISYLTYNNCKGSNYLVGSNMTIADILVAETLNFLHDVCGVEHYGDVMSTRPNVAKVGKHPGKAYLY